MSHFLETAVGGVDAAADNAEALAFDLLAEQVVLGEENLLMESAEFTEFFQIEQHEHARGKGMMQTRKILEEIVACVKQVVDPVTVAAEDVCGNTMKVTVLGEFDGAAHNRRMCQFDVRIEKENIGAVGVSCAQVAADGRHSAADHADVQAVAEAENDLGRAVG